MLENKPYDPFHRFQSDGRAKEITSNSLKPVACTTRISKTIFYSNLCQEFKPEWAL